eukprot:3967099-Pyramimonas_sp.AAC.1
MLLMREPIAGGKRAYCLCWRSSGRKERCEARPQRERREEARRGDRGVIDPSLVSRTIRTCSGVRTSDVAL